MSLLKDLLVPPGNLLVLAALGLALHRRRPVLSRRIVIACVALLYLCSTAFFGSLSLSWLDVPPLDTHAGRDAQAIVLLGGGTRGYAAEYGAETVNALSMVRLRYAARLHRQTGLPILAAGGSVRAGGLSEAQQMQAMLTGEMGVPVRWLENRSTDTYGNAVESARILRGAGIERVLLVTHAWHVPRARLAFTHAGLRVVPAPTGGTTFEWGKLGARDFVPRPSSLLSSYHFFHEAIGYVVYSLRMRFEVRAPEDR